MKDAFSHAAAPWADHGLAEALERLDSVLHRARSGAELSFDVGAASPESMLLQELAPASAGVSFAAPSQVDVEAKPDAGELLDSLLAQARTAIHVETRAHGQVVASTTIGFAGDARNTVMDTASTDDFERHQQAIAAELRARGTRMRIFSAVVAAAGKIAIAAGTGNPLLGLSAAWRFISAVMAERDQIPAV